MFELNRISYEVKPLNIGLKNKTLFFVSELNKVIVRYTYNIDMTLNRKYESEIAEMTFQLNQSVKYLEDLKANEDSEQKDIQEYEDIVIKQTERLTSKQSEFDSNELCKMNAKLYTESMTFALEEFVTNEKLIFDFLNTILDKKIQGLNLADMETKRFIIQVVNFFLIQRNGN